MLFLPLSPMHHPVAPAVPWKESTLIFALVQTGAKSVVTRQRDNELKVDKNGFFVVARHETGLCEQESY
jgi:hypothetical protein